MKVGIIVYSHSGNTLLVAQKLEEALRSAGHAVSIERVEPVNGNPRAPGPVELKSAPDVGPYDAVIFASAVQAFSLAPPMKLYLSRIPGLNGRKIYCFVTQHLKQQWLGGKKAVRQIAAACKVKGADVIPGGIVNWSGGSREKQIDDIVKKLGAIR